jgi:AcrR family transcriptional regulator
MPRTRKPVSRQAAAAPLRRRRRRSPELARQELLDAAERVFSASQPDRVGLKEVAQEAGVSHALITHYFGTYAGLLEAALERRITAMRDVLLARLREPGGLGRPDELLEIVFRTLEDPVHLRLIRWLFASERPAAIHAFGLQRRGIAMVADQVARTLAPEPDASLVHDLEMTLVTALAAAYGYAIARYALAGALGRDPSPALDDEVRGTLAAMVHGHIRRSR